MRNQVAVFVPSLRGGGAERAMLVFAEGLLELGVDVDILVASKEGACKEMVPPKARLFDFNTRYVSGSLFSLISYLRKHRPVALFSTMSNANVAAVLARMFVPDVRLVLRQSIGPLTEPRTTIKQRAILYLAQILYPRANAIVAVSKGVASELAALNGKLRDKIAVLPTPVVSARMLRQLEERPNHRWLTRKECPVVLAVGRLEPQKDFETLIGAFARLRARMRARLLILGEGRERFRLEKLAEILGVREDVDMPGYIENPFPYFRSVDLFVLSSRYEGMPNVLIQALASGAPVVATDCPSGPKECLEDGKWGALVQVGDIEALSTAMEESLKQPEKSNGAASHITLEFGAANAAQRYLDIAGVALSPQRRAA